MSRPDSDFDAIVVGSGPNGLSAAVVLAQNGLSVKVIEAADSFGGGTRTKELTEPGFLHDVCSAVHPTAAGSPFLSSLSLNKYGLEWIHPDYPVAHPLDHGQTVVIERSFDKTLDRLGKDAKNYRNLLKDMIDSWPFLAKDIFGSLRNPKHPLSLARFGWYGMFSAKLLSQSIFDTPELRAYFAGLAAHSILPLEKAFTASFGLILGISVHSVGWPIAKGGSIKISEALVNLFTELGGEIELNRRIRDLRELPDSVPILFDLTPHQINDIAGFHFNKTFSNKLKAYKYGPGSFKIDFALSEQVPWENPENAKAGTLHLGGTFNELAYSEREVWKGNHPEKPYVLVAQQSNFDPSRAPKGKHTLWAYCHVPNGSTKDMSIEIENQIERFAPGFKDTIISKSVMNTVQFEKYNANYIGGDINGGAQTFNQLIGRPVLKWNPYKLPYKQLYICSSSTPPGGGVHGMCGFNAAKSVLKNEFGIKIDI